MVIDATVLFDLLRIVVNKNDERIKKLADTLFELYAASVTSVSSSDLKYCELYITLCKEIISNQLNISEHKIDITNIFKRHLTNQIFRKDTYVREALKSILDTEISASRIADIVKKLNTYIGLNVSKKYISRLYNQMKEGHLSYSVDDQSKSIDGVKNLLDEFKATLFEVESVSCNKGAVEIIDLGNKANIRDAYRMFHERRISHVLKTGLRGLNQMFGPAEGMALGESILFAARSHNFKSGMCIKMLPWITKYAVPPKCPGKKPMILLISLENEGFQNMFKVFTEMYKTFKGSLPPPDMTEEMVVNEIYSYFGESNYAVVIERYLPEYFGYNEFVALIEQYQNAGFHIAATIIDYITQMKVSSNGSGNANHEQLQTLCNRVINYCKAIGTTLITAAQLNKGASDIAASGIPHPVKYYSERHLAGSLGIFREFDCVIFLEIEKDDQGVPWLTMNWGKHRYVDDTPETHKFVAYKFEGKLGLIDDIEGEFKGSRNLYKKKDAKEASVSDIEAILGS